MSPLREVVGATLRKRRVELGWTQGELGESANLSTKYISEVERGEANVTLDALEAILKALQWDGMQLFTEALVDEGSQPAVLATYGDATTAKTPRTDPRSSRVSRPAPVHALLISDGTDGLNSRVIVRQWLEGLAATRGVRPTLRTVELIGAQAASPVGLAGRSNAKRRDVRPRLPRKPRQRTVGDEKKKGTVG